jgi:hypothetical protein
MQLPITLFMKAVPEMNGVFVGETMSTINNEENVRRRDDFKTKETGMTNHENEVEQKRCENGMPSYAEVTKRKKK